MAPEPVAGAISDRERKEVLAQFGLQLTEVKKIWAFGLTPDSQANVLLDQTKGCSYLHEVKEVVCQAFQEAVMGGVYTDEPLRGVLFELHDVKLHPDSVHRGVSQIAPATKRALFAAQMQANPVLLEPLYRCDITAPRSALPGVYSTLRVRRAIIADADEQDEMADRFGIVPIRAFLPVSESFGFTELLRKNTSGQAFPQTVFSHWQPVKGDLLDPDSPAHAVATAIRQRKGLNPTLPPFSDYNCSDLAPPSKASSSSPASASAPAAPAKS
jgi:elongation factor 2